MTVRALCSKEEQSNTTFPGRAEPLYALLEKEYMKTGESTRNAIDRLSLKS